MANKKEKVFTIHYQIINSTDINASVLKLHEFMDKFGTIKNGNGKEKYLYWTRFLPNFYTLATLENTYWDVNKLGAAIYKHMEKKIRFVIFEVQDAPAQGRMPDDFWKAWNDSQDLTGHFQNLKRAQKLKKIITYTKRKAELERKEKELKRRKADLEKSISLKKRENELKAKEREIEEMEKLLHDEPEIEEPPKKKRWWK